MANFLNDLFDSVTGQQATPQSTIINTNDLLSQAYGTATGQAPNVIAYNQALAPGLMNVQLGVERQYDPNAFALRSGTSKSILDQLNLGTSLSPEVQADINRKLLESGSATGFGASPGGLGNVFYQTGLEAEAMGRQRRMDAMGAVSNQRDLNSLYNPNRGFQPQEIAGDIRDVQAAQDNFTNLKENIRRQNFSALLNTGGKILGTVAGGIVGGMYGNPQMGMQIGGSVGGSLIQGSSVAGQPQRNAGGEGGGGFLSSILGNMGRPSSVKAQEAYPVGSDQYNAMIA